MWEEILATSEASPVYGAGFEVYDLTGYGSTTLSKWQVPNVHNGYLQIYLDLGVIGLVILAGTILFGLVKVAADQPGTGKAGAFLRLALILVVVLYNWTEAAYRSVSSMWLLFLLANMNVGLNGTVREAVTFAKRLWPHSLEPTGAPPGVGQAAVFGKPSGGAIVPRFGSPSTNVPRRPTLQRRLTGARGKV
jgi:O-antigen ligase